MSAPRALVIGSEGNVGRPLCSWLRRQGWDVLGSDQVPGCRPDYVMADIRTPSDLLPAFDWGPDVVFHLAAMVSRVTCEQAPSLAVATNLQGVQNVLELTKRTGARLVYLSTSEVYGPGHEVMDERERPRPNNRYGLTKLLSESLVAYEFEQYGLQAVTLRPFMIYDEDEDLGAHRSAMIRFAHELALGRPIEVHRGAARGWLHVSDAVRAIEAAGRLDRHVVINVGNPDVRPIEELAELVRVELGASPDLVRVRNLPERMTLVKRPLLERQHDLLGVDPRVSLEEGVRRVCRRVRERLAERGLLARGAGLADGRG